MPLDHSITHLMLYNVIFFNVLIFIATNTGQFTVKKYCKTMFPVIWDGILVPVYFITCKYVYIYHNLLTVKLIQVKFLFWSHFILKLRNFGFNF